MTRYHAPSVSYPAGRGRLESWGLGVLCGLAWLLLAVAAGQGAQPWRHPQAAWSLGLGAGLCVSAAGMVWWRLRAVPTGWLCWRQGGWSWHARLDAAPRDVARVDLVCDVQQALLVRVRAAGDVPRWLWLERSRDPLRWDDLRRAVWAARR
ncbi:hypothetical protein [Hydrogenophaga sp. OTU3427]|uniref:hypothetical protein n=1 Tax=Hydrogenophaga sp. OTU3427 TaxID=3043856 RepID=UPI00313C1080